MEERRVTGWGGEEGGGCLLGGSRHVFTDVLRGCKLCIIFSLPLAFISV